MFRYNIVVCIKYYIFSDAPHRTAVSMALLKLSESGKLMELKNKWWSVPPEKMCPVIFMQINFNLKYK